VSITGWDGVTLTVEMAISEGGSTGSLWDVGLWDDALWGAGFAWTDVSDRLRSIHTDRAFSRGVSGWQPGRASLVLDNRDGNLSPANLTGDFAVAGVTQIRPALDIRITASYAGIPYPLWYGYAHSLRESWTGGPAGSGDAILTIECLDEFARLARVDGYTVPIEGAGELSGLRVHRVLDAAGHSGTRNIQSGEMTLQGTTHDKAPLAELADVEFSEGGALWVEVDGSITFEGQYSLIESSRSIVSQGTFTDDLTGNSYAHTEMDYSDDLLINWAIYTAQGGVAQTVDDPTSRALYGNASDTRTLIVETNAQALARAQWTIQQYKDPEYRFTSLTVNPRRDPATLWPQVLGRSVRDQITVVRNPPGGFEISKACHVRGVSHAITPAEWVTTWPLSSAEPYLTLATSLWDSGLWDQALWTY
jgi:hypothetical protein